VNASQQPKKAADPNAPKELGKPLNPGVQVTRLRYSVDGKLLAAACFDGTVKFWDVSGKEPVKLPDLDGHNGWVTDLAFGQRLLFTADSWGSVKGWIFTEGMHPVKPRAWSIDAAHDGWIRAISYHPRATAVATCGKDGFIRVWGRLRPEKWHETDLKTDVLSVCFATDGGSVFAGDLFGVVREVKAGKVTRTFEAKELHKADRVQDVGGARCLLVSGDGKTLFVAGGEPKTGGFVQAIPLLVAFDLATGKRVSQWKGASDNEGYVTDLAWHTDGYVVFTTSGQPGQGKLCFWKLGEEKPFFVSTKQPNCHSVAISPDGGRTPPVRQNANRGLTPPAQFSRDHTGSITCKLTPTT
jgi:WD40 repeat protein